MAGQLRAAIYCRVSSTVQEDNSSLETQAAACRAYAAQHGFAVLAEYREVHTGVELWERPKLTELRQAIRDGAVDGVVCYSVDRLARDPVHLGVVLSEADYAGVAVHFVTEPLDDSPEGQLIRFVRGYAAKIEHEKIRERTLRGRIARVQSGRPPVGARPPYGYRWVEAVNPATGRLDKVRLEPDPKTAPIVRRIFEAIASGTPAHGVARALTAEGIPTPTGRDYWHVTTIANLLRHPVYTGQHVAMRWKEERRRDRHGRIIDTIVERPRSEWLALPGVAEPIVSQELAQQAEAQLRANKQHAIRNNRNPEAFLLRGGHAVCGYCGHTLQAYNHNRYGPVYRDTMHCERHGCPEFSIRAHLLDEPVWHGLKARLLDPSLIAREVERLAAEDPAADDLAAIDRRLAELDRKLRNLAGQLAETANPVVAGVLKEELERLANERTRLEAERETLEHRRQEWREAQQRLADLDLWVQRVARNLEGADYETKRLALRACNVKVKVWNTKHLPRWQAEMTLGGDPIVFTSADVYEIP